MTLILSAATKDAVIQVSDRRVVRLNPNGTVRREDDGSNKAVVYCGHVAFAYTGLAEMSPRRQRTDEWLVELLACAQPA